MKISLALLLLAAACTGSQGMTFRSRVICCSKEDFSHQRIPEFKIQDYRNTSSSCTHKAVLVKLPKRTVCVDPEERWFQDYLKRQKKPNSTSM
ncbi:CCL13 protein, partial [Notiomystis cincta]|nr:CCL13 protein [Notiomystis cincta]